MDTPMDSWNDDRLDELNGRMDKGFAHVDERFIRLEGEMKEGFARVDDRFVRLEGEMKEGFAEIRGELRQMNDRFDRRFDCVDEKFNRLMHALMVAGLSFGITTFATLGGLFVTQI